MTSYDSADRAAILEFAQRLEGNTIAETNKKYGAPVPESTTDREVPYMQAYRGKGSFGNALEELYFGKKNDNVSQPDFPEAGVELKASPLRTLADKKIRVKERLVLNKFTYTDIDKETYETSRFLSKDVLILLVFYFFEKSQAPENAKVDLVDFWECVKEDGEQIRRDWETIAAKVHAGKAEDISEGDTLYLGACTKGATRETSMQAQPHSTIPAPGRALCFKVAYINHVYLTLKERKSHRMRREVRFVKDGTKGMEGTIASLFAPYIGKDESDICSAINIDTTAKNKYALIARAILGFRRGASFHEFVAADIQVKTIRIERGGTINEAMSFRQIKFKEIVGQEWEDSDLYHDLTCKFIIVVFKASPSAAGYYLSAVHFWNMPEKDLEVAGQAWEKAKQAVAADDFGRLPKSSDHSIIHVRTHGRDSKDVMETPYGRFVPKRSFWLNTEYVRDVILASND